MADDTTVTERMLVARDVPTQPVASVAVVLLAADTLVLDDLRARVEARLAYVPRWRRLFTPSAWADDHRFGIERHVREIGLPAPAGLAELQARVGEVAGALLARDHPLWEVLLVRGLRGRRAALIVRVHPALVDAGTHVHLLQELLEDSPLAEVDPIAPWEPEPAPELISAATSFLVDVAADPGRMFSRAVRGIGALVDEARGRPSERPRRTIALASADLTVAEVRRVAQRRGCSVHDVLLTLATGLLGQAGGADPVVSVPFAERGAEPGTIAVTSTSLVLPVGQQMSRRLDAVATLTASVIDKGRSVPAAELVDQPGLTAASLHTAARRHSALGRDTAVVTNVPGPTTVLYLGEVPVSAIYLLDRPVDDERACLTFMSYLGRIGVTWVGDGPAPNLEAALRAGLTALEEGR